MELRDLRAGSGYGDDRADFESVGHRRSHLVVAIPGSVLGCYPCESPETVQPGGHGVVLSDNPREWTRPSYIDVIDTGAWIVLRGDGMGVRQCSAMLGGHGDRGQSASRRDGGIPCIECDAKRLSGRGDGERE